MINSRLLRMPERPDPEPLESNDEIYFLGRFLLGDFTLTTEMLEGLSADGASRQVVFPFLNADELTHSPEQLPAKHVINFGEMELHEAERYPNAIEHVRRYVKPERDRLKGNPDAERRRAYWWRYARATPTMDEALRRVNTCWVMARTAKHLAFSRVPSAYVFSQSLYVLPIETTTLFAVLQSRVHDGWAWLLSSTMKEDLSYTPSDCLATFPFPQSDPRAVIPALEEVGERLYAARAKYMLDTQQGLTQTYNQLKDPRVDDPRVVALRRLHEAMDRAVVAAYGWEDLAVPAYGTPTTEAEKKAQARFEDAVIDRLFALNAQRAAEERAARESAPKGGKEKRAKGRKKGEGSGQGSLGIG